MIATYWLEWLGAMNPGVLIVAAVALAATVIAVAAIAAGAWRRVRQTETRTALVGMMLQRGLSVADIERVMSTCAADVDVPADAETHVIGLLKENDYSGDDVERVLDAARKQGRIDAGAIKLIETLVEQGAKAREIESLLDARSPRPAPAL